MGIILSFIVPRFFPSLFSHNKQLLGWMARGKNTKNHSHSLGFSSLIALYWNTFWRVLCKNLLDFFCLCCQRFFLLYGEFFFACFLRLLIEWNSTRNVSTFHQSRVLFMDIAVNTHLARKISMCSYLCGDIANKIPF